MKKVFNRGFTQGFLFQDYLNLAQDIPGNQGIKIGKMINYSKKRKMLDIKLSDTLYQNDRIYFPKNDSYIIHELIISNGYSSLDKKNDSEYSTDFLVDKNKAKTNKLVLLGITFKTVSIGKLITDVRL